MKDERMTATCFIKQAYMSLLAEKLYSEITVTDLVNKAGVARITYYRNFSTLEEVMDSIVEDIKREFEKAVVPFLQEKGDAKWEVFVREYVNRAYDNKSKFTIMLATNITIFIEKFRDKGMDVEKIADLYGIDKYIMFGKLGIVEAITKRWILSGAKEPKEDIVKLIVSCVIKI